MTNMKEDAGKLEWRIKVDDNGGSSGEVLAPESGSLQRAFKCLIMNRVFRRVWMFLKMAWRLAREDPRKVFHCLKVGIALTVVSLFYYMRPLYDGVGGTAMWAVMTVVVVFEYTVGATISKCLNRVMGTSIAGLLAVGVHSLASKSGNKLEPFIIGSSLFLIATAATFSRFIPGVKKKFDYGFMIFILTFSLVSVSGFRVEKLLDMARHRLSTIIIGTSFCILTSMLVFPVWAGQELHGLITQNLEKLADSLDGCVAEFFKDSERTTDASMRNPSAYKCVLNSKATEESMANLARWEPSHGRFSFKHPWKQYLKIGASMRKCAYSVEALNSLISNEKQVSEVMKQQLSDTCLRVTSSASGILRELAVNLEAMKKSSKLEISIEEMSSALQELKKQLESLPALVLAPGNDETNSVIMRVDTIPLIQVVPLVTFASLLIEIPSRVEAIVAAVEEVAKMAGFKAASDDQKSKEQLNVTPKILPKNQTDDRITMKTLQGVVRASSNSLLI